MTGRPAPALGANDPGAAPSGTRSRRLIDLSSPGLDADPFPTYAWLRQHAPVYWWEAAQCWVLTRYADVTMLLTDPRFTPEYQHYKTAPPPGRPDEDLAQHELLTKYGMFWMPRADHGRVRRIAASALASYGPTAASGLFEPAAEQILSAAAGQDPYDVAADFAWRFPLRAITSVIGIPAEMQDEFRHFPSYGTAVLGEFFQANSDDTFEKNMAFLPRALKMLDDLIEDRRARPCDDLLSALAHAERAGERLSNQELIAALSLILSAGSRPVRYHIGLVVLNLLKHPDQLRILQQEPGLLDQAIHEVGRFDNFGKLSLPRFALEDLELHGVTIRRGQQVHASYTSAQRDPEAFPDPDRFDIRRDLSRSILFGYGRHVCMGRSLAQLMVATATREFFGRFPAAQLRGEPRYARDTFFRKLSSCQVHLG
jgi:cytochrome P450 enzyme